MAGTESLHTEQDIDLDSLLPPDPDDAPETKDKIDVEIVDDTPEDDRGRQKLGENPDPTDEEIEEYSEKVQKRIKKLQHGYHDERRAKEQALRERDEAVRAAQSVWQQHQEMQKRFSQSENVAVSELKTASEAKVKTLKEEIQRAYNEGDAEKIANLTEQIADEKLRLRELSSYQPQFKEEKPAPAGQPEQNTVYSNQPAPQGGQIQPDERAVAWTRENKWFGKDRELTAYAMGVHEKLVLEEGIDPQSDPDTYYGELDKRIKRRFPELAEGTQQQPPRRQTSAPVASVSRGSSSSRGKTKVLLTQSQVNIANKLGVPLEEYARQVAMLDNKG